MSHAGGHEHLRRIGADAALAALVVAARVYRASVCKYTSLSTTLRCSSIPKIEYYYKKILCESWKSNKVMGVTARMWYSSVEGWH